MEKKDQKSNGVLSDSIAAEISSSDGKCCEICRTTKTPLWRGGPSGPKSVCNACGIRYRKKRRELLGLNNRVEKTKKDNNSVMRLLGFATDLLLQQRSILKLRRRRQLAEEEEAAVLLMALSSGFLYA